jgi:PKD repeat protein
MGSNPSVPNANFSNNTPCVGTAVNFTDLSTGGVTGWDWDFGDGGTSTSQSPSHTYAAAGTYTVTLECLKRLY